MRPRHEASPGATVLAVDVGNSKTDLALLAADGSVLGAVRGASASHQAVGLRPAMRTLGDLIARASAQAGLPATLPVAPVGALCMAGFDTPRDERKLRRAIEEAGIARELVLRNDVHAILRAGADRGWGVAVVAGAGINGLGIGPTGRVARFAGLGGISGDWEGVAEAALAAAVRGRDGRGPRTVLERLVPAHFGLGRPAELTDALYRGRIGEVRLRELAPVVFAAAADRDAVAVAIVERLGDEIAAFAIAAIRRTRATRLDVDLVLAGGIARAGDPRLLGRVMERVSAVAPRVRLVVLDRPPVVGSALLGFDRLAPAGIASADVARRLRAELTDGRLARGTGAA